MYARWRPAELRTRHVHDQLYTYSRAVNNTDIDITAVSFKQCHVYVHCQYVSRDTMS